MSSEELWQHREIETVSGLYFNTGAPVFDPATIAHGLANKCRFNGQCRSFYPVSSHSIMVSRLMAILGGDPFEGLMHDGNEAYLPDVPSPYKAMLPDLCKLENRVDLALRVHFGLEIRKTQECKDADIIALLIEAHYLLPSKGLDSHWDALAPYRKRAQAFIRRGFCIPGYDVPPARAEAHFLARYYELCAQR